MLGISVELKVKIEVKTKNINFDKEWNYKIDNNTEKIVKSFLDDYISSLGTVISTNLL